MILITNLVREFRRYQQSWTDWPTISWLFGRFDPMQDADG